MGDWTDRQTFGSTFSDPLGLTSDRSVSDMSNRCTDCKRQARYQTRRI